MPAQLNVQNIDIPPNTVFSNLDKAYAVLNYARLKPNPKAPEWTIPFALDAAGVTGTSRDKILKSTDPLEIRQLFQIWNATQRSKFTGEATNGSSTPPTVTVPASGPTGAAGRQPLADRVDAILKEAKVPSVTVDTVHAAITRELVLISQEVAQRVLSG